MASDLYSQIRNSRGSLERMVARLPGFQGYLDRQARRQADRLIRDHLATAISERIRRLAQIERRLLDSGGFNSMSRTQSLKTRLQTYHDRIKSAAPGYSSFFDAVKVDAVELDLLYGFDELQLVYADRLAGALDTLETAVKAKQGVDEALDALDDLVREANEAYTKREDTLLNLTLSA